MHRHRRSPWLETTPLTSVTRATTRCALVVIVAVMLIGSLVPTTTAHADEARTREEPSGPQLRIVHADPPAVVENDPLDLVIGVTSDCGFILCTPIELRVHYFVDGEPRGMLSAIRPSWPPLQTALLTVPAEAVTLGFHYRISARQSRCQLFGSCSVGNDHSPDQGSHRPLVVPNPSPGAADAMTPLADPWCWSDGRATPGQADTTCTRPRPVP